MIDFNRDAAFWVFNQVSNLAYTRYNLIAPIVKEHQSKLEDDFLKTIDAVSEAATKIYNIDKQLGLNFITDYSVSQSEHTVEYWKRPVWISVFQICRWKCEKTTGMTIDDNGNGMGVPKYPDQPGYGEEYYRNVIKETGRGIVCRSSGYMNVNFDL
ncbi:MAG: hypothetical protein R2771_01770 [Saprospiraceae bacterium]